MAQAKPEAGAKHPGGRPTKRTPEGEETILRCTRAGMSLRSCAARARVDHATVLRWRDDDPEFCTALCEARAEGEEALIRHAVTSDGKGAMFVLERSYRGRWAKREHHTVDTRSLDPVKTEAEAIAAVEAAAAALKLA